MASYDQVFVHIDALDECPDADGSRRQVLSGLRRLLVQAPNLRILATSRDVPDIRNLMDELSVTSLPTVARTVNPDIERFVSEEMSRSHKLSRLDVATKTLIEKTLSQKADGMFRWVHCSFQELNRSKVTKPKAIEAALAALPKTLDEMYDRMLNNIGEDDRPGALTLLRWLAYANTPLSLEQLAEASIIDATDDPTADGIVDLDNRGDWGDVLEILADFVIVMGTDGGRMGDECAESHTSNRGINEAKPDRPIEESTKIRLAHFSVKEYLESSRILQRSAHSFHLDPGREHRFLTQSCLAYLSYYSMSSQKILGIKDLVAFPLLEYAAKSWPHHARLRQSGSNTQILSFLASTTKKSDWLRVHNPDRGWGRPFETDMETIGDPLYYLSSVGLEPAVRALLSTEVDVNAQGGLYGNALQAASFGGQEKMVEMLLHYGANVNAQGGINGNALQAASVHGHEKIVEMLLHYGANVNAQGGFYGNALQAASANGQEKIVEMLLRHGADLNPQGGHYGNALQAASYEGYEKVVEILPDHGANINAQGGRYSNALYTASVHGHGNIVQMLLEHGADVNAQFRSKTALSRASEIGRQGIVQMLLDHGADPNYQENLYNETLEAASAWFIEGEG